MAERSAIYQATQIGLETTPGTPVAANRRLLSVGFTMSPNPDVQVFRPSGVKYPTLAALNREWTEIDLEGALTYTEVIYLLSAIMGKTTPTGSTAKSWAFAPSSTEADDIATFTIQQGDAVRAREVSLALLTELTFSFSRSEISVSGSMIAGPMKDNVSLTASPTEVDLVPVLGPDVAVYLANTYAGLDTATPLQRPTSIEWSLGNRFAPAWYLNQQVGFSSFVEVEPSFSMSMTMAADAEGMQLLSALREGQMRYIRIESIGPEIDGGPDTYLFQLDTAVQVVDVGDFSEVEGIEAIEWEFQGFHSSELGGSTAALVVNELASL